MTIQDLTQPEMLAIIDSNEQNKKLKFDAISPIRIFNFFNLRDNPERECSVTLDTEGIIKAVAMYRHRNAKEREGLGGEDYVFISLGVDESLRGQGIGGQLLDHVLNQMKQKVKLVALSIEPDDIDYYNRWESFLYRKFREHGLMLRNHCF